MLDLPYNWRVTKYNPARRNAEGHYPTGEWSFFGEVGDVFNNKLLTYEDYYAAETAYVDAVFAFLSAAGLDTLRVVRGDSPIPAQVDAQQCRDIALSPASIKVGMLVGGDILADVIRLNLRDILWCKLEVGYKFYLHFGWDFYMYLGSTLPCEEAIQYAEGRGLFVEAFLSPYLEDE